ncbi:UNVERIFIED_CONTAM: hypothetical protein FKN15_010540, partial [Acipenser sinensis]
IAKNKKPHTIGEQLPLPAAIGMCEVMIGAEAAQKLKTILLSDNTVQRRIEDMASDIKTQLIERIKVSDAITLQLDELTNVAEKSHLVAFVRFVWLGDFNEEMLLCREIPSHGISLHTAKFSAKTLTQ